MNKQTESSPYQHHPTNIYCPCGTAKNTLSSIMLILLIFGVFLFPNVLNFGLLLPDENVNGTPHNTNTVHVGAEFLQFFQMTALHSF